MADKTEISKAGISADNEQQKQTAAAAAGTSSSALDMEDPLSSPHNSLGNESYYSFSQKISVSKISVHTYKI